MGRTDQQVFLEDLIRGMKKVVRDSGMSDGCYECYMAENAMDFLLAEWRVLTGKEPEDLWHLAENPWPCPESEYRIWGTEYNAKWWPSDDYERIQ